MIECLPSTAPHPAPTASPRAAQVHALRLPRASDKWQDTLLLDFFNREPVLPQTDRLHTLRAMIVEGLDRLPRAGEGHTDVRWRCLAVVAAHDLALLRLYDGHVEALAALDELDGPEPPPLSSWGLWTSEVHGRLDCTVQPDGGLLLDGHLRWCAGATGLSHALVTAWHADGRGPQLVAVSLDQPALRRVPEAWCGVGLAAAQCADVHVHGARGVPVGEPGDDQARAGHWQAAAGTAAGWYGAALALAQPLLEACQATGGAVASRLTALGTVDIALCQARALLHEAARWIDQHPQGDASAWALRTRAAAESAATLVLATVGRALGAAPFCNDAAWARRAADLPVYLNQTHGECDLAALGLRQASREGDAWTL